MWLKLSVNNDLAKKLLLTNPRPLDKKWYSSYSKSSADRSSSYINFLRSLAIKKKLWQTGWAFVKLSWITDNFLLGRVYLGPDRNTWSELFCTQFLLKPKTLPRRRKENKTRVIERWLSMGYFPHPPLHGGNGVNDSRFMNEGERLIWTLRSPVHASGTIQEYFVP